MLICLANLSILSWILLESFLQKKNEISHAQFINIRRNLGVNLLIISYFATSRLICFTVRIPAEVPTKVLSTGGGITGLILQALLLPLRSPIFH
ncbi:MAG: hypothetical protein EAX86_13625 [Candidatus Heimdallarchaeota archaeon]|nr:hypothetical protein [Candidatus Heimdallarchaeota archaeon]